MTTPPENTPPAPPSEPAIAPPDLLCALADNAPAPLLATDASRCVVFANRAARALLGERIASLLGADLLSLLGEADREAALAKLRQADASGTLCDIELPGIQDGDHDAPELLMKIAPLHANGEAPAHLDHAPWAVWLIDQTAYRDLADKLAQAEKMASLGTLSGGVAHHFNNILGGVATYVDYALTSGNELAMKRALQMTAEAAARASKITHSLLTFAEQDMHRADLADLTEVVLTFAHLVERPLAERGIEFRLNVQPIPVLAVESNCMHQVLGHLLSNSEEAMPEGGTIHLTLDRDGDEAVMVFEDTGMGIAKQDLPLVFEPFFTTKGLLAGGDRVNLGLGLSVVHGQILEMGGHIKVTSEKAQGTRFEIRLPLRPQPED